MFFKFIVLIYNSSKINAVQDKPIEKINKIAHILLLPV